MVSVIVPIYNGAETIRRCLNSIRESHNQNFEIILINDGSVDETEKICQQYVKMDDRITLVSISNGGVSNARNIGLKKAKGDWVVFIDADDYVDVDFLTIPSDFDNADVIEKGYVIVRKYSEENVLLTRYELLASKNINSYFIEYIGYKTRALWNKIFKRSVINHILFKSEISMGEDFIFFLECFPSIFSYALCAEGKYFYCENESSATANNFRNTAKRIEGLLYNASLIANFLKTNPKIPVYPEVIRRIYIPLIDDYNEYLSDAQRRELYNLKVLLLKSYFCSLRLGRCIESILDCIKTYNLLSSR